MRRRALARNLDALLPAAEAAGSVLCAWGCGSIATWEDVDGVRICRRCAGKSDAAARERERARLRKSRQKARGAR